MKTKTSIQFCYNGNSQQSALSLQGFWPNDIVLFTDCPLEAVGHLSACTLSPLLLLTWLKVRKEGAVTRAIVVVEKMNGRRRIRSQRYHFRWKKLAFFILNKKKDLRMRVVTYFTLSEILISWLTCVHRAKERETWTGVSLASRAEVTRSVLTFDLSEFLLMYVFLETQ